MFLYQNMSLQLCKRCNISVTYNFSTY